MPVEEAAAFLAGARGARDARAAVDVGLGYVTLGQMLNTLSGGERQRLKLAIEMSGDTDVTSSTSRPRGCTCTTWTTSSACSTGWWTPARTVVVIEHNLDVVARADWVIDMGPGAGHDGGRVVFSGTPAGLVKAKGSLTGEHLRRRLGSS